MSQVFLKTKYSACTWKFKRVSDTKFTVSVGDLASFCCKTGDLDLRFTPAPSGVEGIEGHKAIYARRNDDYQSEISLEYHFDELLVRGRADGFDPDLHRLEEIKTFKGSYKNLASNKKQLHWGQAKIYGAIMCQQNLWSELNIALIYFNIDSKEEIAEQQIYSKTELKQFFDHCCQTYLTWMLQEKQHRQSLEVELESMVFPYPDYRKGQRDLAEAVYKTIALQGSLCLEAPTGIGKTLATIFPALKALFTKKLDRLFFLSAKTPGRKLALDAITQLGLKTIRVLELSARTKSCVHLDLACHGDSCSLASGFYDRLAAARQDAVTLAFLDQSAISEIARRHNVCPYYLSQEMSHWADMVVGDYNYFFDVHALLHALVQAHDWKAIVLMDEAHNLVDRARSMYSAELDRKKLLAVKRNSSGPVKKSLEAINRHLLSIRQEIPEIEYSLIPELSDKLVESVQRFIQSVLTILEQGSEVVLSAELQQFFFDAMHFVEIAELFGEDYIFDYSTSSPSVNRKQDFEIYQLRNLIPGPQLALRYENIFSLIQFSATFRPWNYLRDILGHSGQCQYKQIAPNFLTHQLQVYTSNNISTKYQDRTSSLPALADMVASQVRKVSGNYLVYFSSFAYLNLFSEQISKCYPELNIISQHRSMSESKRTEFLQQFEQNRNLLGLAVLGGAFSEGIDLDGDKLIGAFVITLGLPQWNAANEVLKQRLQQRYGKGYQYAYLYPGLQKVVQAAGRVIRTDEDRGYLYLLDTRFNSPEVRSYLPQWWDIETV